MPLAGFSTGLRHVAAYNPISALTAAVRGLFGNPTATPAEAPWPLQHPVAASVVWCLVLLAITVPLALRRFRQRTED